MTMKKITIEKLRQRIPILVGSVIILSGLLHIVVAVLPIFKVTLPGVYRQYPIIEFSSFQEMSLLAGIILGFCLVILGKGLCERKRRSWWISIIVLFILCLDNYNTGAMIPCGVTGILFIFLLITHKLFKEKSERRGIGYQQLLAWASILIAVGYGVFGSYFLRDQFANLKSWTDAVYFTVVTYATVGYGDITPLTSEARFFTVSMILVGLGAFATTFTFVVGPMIENRIKGVFKFMKRIHDISNHVIICGYTNLGKALIKNLQEKNIPFMVLENSMERKAEFEEEYITVPGNTFQTETFEHARINRAKSVICAFEKDSDNILTILTVKEILEETDNNKTKLISRIDYEENIDKAKKLGVTDIVSPTTMAATSIIDIIK